MKITIDKDRICNTVSIALDTLESCAKTAERQEKFTPNALVNKRDDKLDSKETLNTPEKLAGTPPQWIFYRIVLLVGEVDRVQYIRRCYCYSKVMRQSRRLSTSQITSLFQTRVRWNRVTQAPQTWRRPRYQKRGATEQAYSGWTPELLKMKYRILLMIG